MLENLFMTCCPENPIVWFPVSLIICSIVTFLLSIFPLERAVLPIEEKGGGLFETVLAIAFILFVSTLGFILMPLIMLLCVICLPAYGGYYIRKYFINKKKEIIEQISKGIRKE